MNWQEILITSIGGLFSVLGVLLIKVVTKFVNQLITKMNFEGVEREALLAVAAGIETAQDEFVRHAIEASKDGRLTDVEIKQARDIAYNHAIDISSKAATDLIRKWGSTNIINAKIREVLNAKN